MKIAIAPFIVAGVAALALAGCKVPGQKASFSADAQAFCQTNYTSAEMCGADERCEWKVRDGDGKAVCRAKR